MSSARRLWFGRFAYRTQSQTDRDELTRQAASIATERTGADEFVIIGVDVDSPAYPYNTLALLAAAQSGSLTGGDSADVTVEGD